jgi:hypothetical protein
MIVERYPKSNGVVGGLVLNYEIFSLLDGKTSQVVKHLLWFPKQKSKTNTYEFIFTTRLSLRVGQKPHRISTSHSLMAVLTFIVLFNNLLI